MFVVRVFWGVLCWGVVNARPSSRLPRFPVYPVRRVSPFDAFVVQLAYASGATPANQGRIPPNAQRPPQLSTLDLAQYPDIQTPRRPNEMGNIAQRPNAPANRADWGGSSGLRDMGEGYGIWGREGGYGRRRARNLDGQTGSANTHADTKGGRREEGEGGNEMK
ncbi:hypothetical protein CCMSSC00406_0009317 [Pleurotus cornucopiae]|uniref:Uncharacterized protein n=1 Tax=Pleurotus cornucopiae TaxID=5321 RepID=A0ACB7J6T6_PLECO|nr:hypothetical protein CCMSSC00406_0009317 [Pleurotus cornucopiae]